LVLQPDGKKNWVIANQVGLQGAAVNNCSRLAETDGPPCVVSALLFLLAVGS
jgi:hypothetical protein